MTVCHFEQHYTFASIRDGVRIALAMVECSRALIVDVSTERLT
jgi:hypothetical protein